MLKKIKCFLAFKLSDIVFDDTDTNILFIAFCTTEFETFNIYELDKFHAQLS